jgi:hypothetical protein
MSTASAPRPAGSGADEHERVNARERLAGETWVGGRCRSSDRVRPPDPVTARPAASAVRVSADKLLVHQALAEHCGARSELETAARLARAAKRVGQ